MFLVQGTLGIGSLDGPEIWTVGTAGKLTVSNFDMRFMSRDLGGL